MAVYAVSMLVGGIGGYVKAHSMKSLIAGILSGVVVGAAYFISNQNPKVGLCIGGAVAVALIIVFVIRIQELLAQTPPGSIGMNIGLCSLSAVVAVFLFYAASQVRQ